jgi:hypothetical protein
VVAYGTYSNGIIGLTLIKMKTFFKKTMTILYNIASILCNSKKVKQRSYLPHKWQDTSINKWEFAPWSSDPNRLAITISANEL